MDLQSFGFNSRKFEKTGVLFIDMVKPVTCISGSIVLHREKTIDALSINQVVSIVRGTEQVINIDD